MPPRTMKRRRHWAKVVWVCEIAYEMMPEKTDENWLLAVRSQSFDNRRLGLSYLIIPDCHTDWLFLICVPHDSKDRRSRESSSFSAPKDEANRSKSSEVVCCSTAKEEDSPGENTSSQQFCHRQSLDQDGLRVLKNEKAKVKNASDPGIFVPDEFEVMFHAHDGCIGDDNLVEVSFGKDLL